MCVGSFIENHNVMVRVWFWQTHYIEAKSKACLYNLKQDWFVAGNWHVHEMYNN